MHTHTIRDAGSWRWSISAGENLDWQLRFEVARRWRFGLIATCGYGGQEDFLEGTLALPRLLFLHVGIDTPFKLHRLRPRDGKYGESEALVGVKYVAGALVLLVGHDAMGSYYSTHGRGGAVGRWWRDLKRNRRIVLFDENWLLGKPHYSLDVLEDGIPVVVNVGQWPGDSYRGTAKHTRRTRRRRFSTKVTDGYEIDMQQGIPFPGKGENSWDQGDDAVFGFGGATIDAATTRIIAATITRRERYGGDGWRPSEVAV